MSLSFINTNLPLSFHVLSPEQRLINVLFDELKLLQSTRLTGGYLIGYTPSAFCIEIVCHHGEPRLVIGINLVSQIFAEKSQYILKVILEELRKMDNLPTSYLVVQGVALYGINMYLVYYYIHILKIYGITG